MKLVPGFAIRHQEMLLTCRKAQQWDGYDHGRPVELVQWDDWGPLRYEKALE